MFALRRVHGAPQGVGRRPQLGLEAQLRGGSRGPHCLAPPPVQFTAAAVGPSRHKPSLCVGRSESPAPGQPRRGRSPSPRPHRLPEGFLPKMLDGIVPTGVRPDNSRNLTSRVSSPSPRGISPASSAWCTSRGKGSWSSGAGESTRERFPVVEFGLPAARVYAWLWAELLSIGQPVGTHDLFIAGVWHQVSERLWRGPSKTSAAPGPWAAHAAFPVAPRTAEGFVRGVSPVPAASLGPPRAEAPRPGTPFPGTARLSPVPPATPPPLGRRPAAAAASLASPPTGAAFTRTSRLSPARPARPCRCGAAPAPAARNRFRSPSPNPATLSLRGLPSGPGGGEVLADEPLEGQPRGA